MDLKLLMVFIFGVILNPEKSGGVNIHFNILMIVVLLELRFKQFCVNFTQFTNDMNKVDKKEALNVKNIEQFITYWDYNPSCWIKSITNKFYPEVSGLENRKALAN